MTYIFLIFALNSATSNLHVVPMHDIKQCQASLKAIKIVQDGQGTWDRDIKLELAKCVEVKDEQ